MTYTLPEPTAWAISFDGKTPYKLSDYGDGALLDVEIKRHGGATCKLALYTAETLDSEVDKAYKQGFSHGLKECTPWEDAIIDGLVVAHVYRKEHDTNPSMALNDLISWHVRVALDPTVSSDARALVESGAAQREKELMGVGMEPVAELYFYVDEYGPELTFTPLRYGHLENGKHQIYTADQIAAARLQDEAALKGWLDKTEWVQSNNLPVKYLGWHRADVLKDMIATARLQARKPLTDEQTKVLFSRATQDPRSVKFNAENWFQCGVVMSEAVRGITGEEV